MKARKKLYEVSGEDCLTEHQCQCWLDRFRSGNLNGQGAPHSGCSISTADDETKASTKTKRRVTTRETAEKL